MQTFLVIVIILLAIMTVVSLVRGVIAFLQTSRRDLDEGVDRTREMQLKQNAMMFSRIKYQALAIVAVAVLLMVSGD